MCLVLIKPGYSGCDPLLLQNSEQLLRQALEEKFHPAIPEISVYLTESVGNKTRIDYGTGTQRC